MDQNEKAVSENEVVELDLESLVSVSGGDMRQHFFSCPFCDYQTSIRRLIAEHIDMHKQQEQQQQSNIP